MIVIYLREREIEKKTKIRSKINPKIYLFSQKQKIIYENFKNKNEISLFTKIIF